MTRIAILLFLLLVPVVLGGIWYVNAVERAPVTRARLTAFARRQRLVITAGNGNQVIRYLAVTRRWRATGLMLGLLVSLGWAWRQGGVRVDFLTLFAGWFAGAVVAEFRLARRPSGPRRSASLAPRVPGAYLPRALWVLVPVAAVSSLAVAGLTLVVARGGPAPGLAAGVLCGAAIVLAGAVLLVQRTVLRRPQPADAADVVAADDAIRSRSLHVLAGGGTTLVLYCVLGQLAELPPSGPAWFIRSVDVLAGLGVVAVPLLGWLIATSAWPVRRAAVGGAH